MGTGTDDQPQLLHRVNLATPHIAGHTLEGKQRGTKMIYHALCRFLGIASDTSRDINRQGLTISGKKYGHNDGLNHLLLDCYDISQDDKRLRDAASQENQAARFILTPYGVSIPLAMITV